MQVLPNEIVDLHDVKVFIGHDNFHLFFSVDNRKSRRNEPWTVTTKLGWTLSRPISKDKIAQIATTFPASNRDQSAEQLKTWWSFETCPTRCNVCARSREDKKAIDLLEKTAELSERRYDVGLLWLDDENIPTNIIKPIPNCAHWNRGYKRTLICDNGLDQLHKWTWILTMSDSWRQKKNGGNEH